MPDLSNDDIQKLQSGIKEAANTPEEVGTPEYKPGTAQPFSTPLMNRWQQANPEGSAGTDINTPKSVSLASNSDSNSASVHDKLTPIGTKVNEFAQVKDLSTSKQSEKDNINKDMQSTIILSGITNQSPINAYKQVSQSHNSSDTLNQLISQKAAQDIQGVRDWLDNQFTNDPNNGQKHVQEGSQLLKQYQKEHKDPLAPEAAVTDQLTNHNIPFNLQQERDKEAKQYLAMANDINRAMKQVGWLDTILTSTEDFFIPSINDVRSMDGFVKDINGGTTLKNSTSAYRTSQIQQIVLNYKSMPVERQEAYWKSTLLPAIIRNSHGDAQEMMKFADAFMGPGAGEKIIKNNWENAAWTAANVVPITKLGSVLGMVTKESEFLSNAAKLAELVDNQQKAASLTAMTIADTSGKIGEAMKIVPSQAYRWGQPISFSAADKAHASGLSEGVAQELYQYLKTLSGSSKALENGTMTIEHGVLTPIEQNDVQIRELDLMKNQVVDHFAGNVTIKNAELTNMNSKGFNIKMTITNPEGTAESEINKNVVYSINDATGKVDVTNISGSKLVNSILSPSTIMSRTNRFDLYKNAMQATLNQGQVLKHLDDNFANIFTGLNRNEIKNVEQVIDAGSTFEHPDGNIGKTFSELELQSGITTQKGVLSLNTKERAAYFKWRSFSDDYMYHFENNVYRNRLLKQGYDGVVKDINGDMAIVKKVNNTKGVNRVYDPNTQSMRNMQDITKEELEHSQVMQLKDPMLVPNGTKGATDSEHAAYILSSEKDVDRLPQQLLNKKEGYVPRFYRDEEYFVHKRTPININGGQVNTKQLVGRFASKIQADKYAAQLNATKGSTDFFVLADREMEAEKQSGLPAINSSSGMFGARSSQDIKFGLQQTDPDRVNPIEAYERQIRQLSRFIAKDDSISQGIKAWETTAQAYLHDPSITFRTPIDNINEMTSKLNNLRDIVKAMNSIPTYESRLWEGFVQNLHDWAVEGLNYTGQKVDKLPSILWFKHSNPIDSARTAAFHIQLGLFRPHMFLLHASQIAVSMSLSNPLNAPKVFARTVALMWGERMFNLSARLTNYKLIADADKILNLADASDMVKLHALWDKSGYALMASHNTSVMNMTEKMNMDRGAFSNFMKASQVSFQGGLSFADKYAFINAVEEYGLDKLVSADGKINEAGLADVIARTDRDRLHMAGQDTSQMFKGVLRVPLQYARVTFKIMEALIGKEFTTAQKMRLLTGQTIIYGAAGLGLQDLFHWILRQKGVDPSQFKANYPKAYAALNGGMADLLTNMYVGDVDISKHTALMQGFGEWTLGTLFDQRPFAEKMLGGVGGVSNKLLDTLSQLKTIALGSLQKKSISVGDIMTGMQTLMQSSSSTNDLLKSWYMYKHNEILNSSGLPIVKRQFSTGEVIAQALGFSVQDVQNYYDLKNFNEQQSKIHSKLVDQGLRLLNDYKNAAFLEGDQQAAKDSAAAFQVIRNSMSDQEWNKYMKSLTTKIKSEGKNPLLKELKTFYNKRIPEEIINSINSDKQKLDSSGILYNEQKLNK